MYNFLNIPNSRLVPVLTLQFAQVNKYLKKKRPLLGKTHIFNRMLNFDKLSFWEKETYINHTDFLIIGAGIVGLSTALYLKERFPHKKVTVLERGYLPTGASTKNAGFACIGSPSELLSDLKKSSSNDVFETVNKRWKGLQKLRQLLGDSQIDYQEFGAYELFDESNTDLFKSCQNKLEELNIELEQITGIKACFKIDTDIIPSAQFAGFKQAIKQTAEGQIDTGKMMFSLLQKTQAKGVIIMNGISAEQIEKNCVSTNFGSIKFEKLGICTNGFAKQFLPDFNLEPARAQVLITKPIINLKFKGTYHFDEGFYYFRNIGSRILFGGGRNLNIEGERTTQFDNSQEIVSHLETILANNILPQTDFQVDYSWAGIMGVGKKKAPILRAVDEHIFCGVRLGGMGIAIGTLVGEELAHLMSGH